MRPDTGACSTLCIVAFTLGGWVLPGWGRAAESPIQSIPLASASTGDGTMFRELPPEVTGVHFTNRLRDEHIKRYLLNGSGVCVGDFDNDGLPDIYLASLDGPNRLFRQVGPFRFKDVTERAGVDGGDAWGTGATFVDIDNDGDLDLYACNTGSADLLYINQGDGTFVESGAPFGLGYEGASTMASFADYDRDGDLDLYLLTNRLFSVAEEHPKAKVRMIDGRPTVHPDYRDQYMIILGRFSEAGERDILYRNNGDRTFTDVSVSAGIDGYDMGLSATWWDYNNDGWLDLYVGNDMKTPDHLYKNNGDGTFTDVVESTVPHTPWFSMGADFADINNDGLFDLLIADMSSTTHYKQKTTMGEMGRSRWFLESARPLQYMRNAFYLNTGAERFMEIAYLAGVASTDWTWAVKFGDLDNDGLVDLFVTNGMIRNLMDSDWVAKAEELTKQGRTEEAQKLLLLPQMPPLFEENLAYKNRGDLRFESVGRAWGLNCLGVSHGAAYADLDRDGDLDLVVNNLNEPVGIYRNDSSGGHRVLVRLVGIQSNRFGIGAMLTLETDAGLQVRQLILARGYMSADEPLIHFGLGRDPTIKKLTVDWPSGYRQVFEQLAADRFYTITEANSDVARSPTRAPTPPQFVDYADESGLRFRHRERPFDDYRREPLLPNKLSQLGPGLAWGDADGDGYPDLFVGGAAGQPGALFHNVVGTGKPAGQRRFERASGGPWEADANCEDMGVLWFDADSDGDMDLYVVSGGVECEPADPVLGDRLYLNDGTGAFHRARAGTLPNVADSGSVVTAGDLDGDGDLDLFVGGRVIPGKYPLTPDSRLLRNNQGRFQDVTDELAPGLRHVGLVTGAVWSDADNDGRLDLLITQEWGPVKFFHNTGGALLDRTRQAGLDKHSGWWNGIAAGDFDGDSDMDYVVTNFGLNTKYVAHPTRPARLYCKDFDASGTMDLVEAMFEHHDLFPVRGRSCSSNAMPFVAEKFTTYHDFGLANLGEVYTENALASAKLFEATQLQSGVLINQGGSTFRFHALPRIAQASPGFGVAVADFDADGKPDIYCVQNFFSPQPETGRMDGGLSLLLRGNGDGTFTPVTPPASGLVVPQDAMALTLCDLDDDTYPDLVVSVNDGDLRVFRNRGSAGRHNFVIRLLGKPGNPTAVGARVTVVSLDGTIQTAEVHAGSGYLSQSIASLFFGLGEKTRPGEVRVRWPNGDQTTVTTEALTSRRLTISQP